MFIDCDLESQKNDKPSPPFNKNYSLQQTIKSSDEISVKHPGYCASPFFFFFFFYTVIYFITCPLDKSVRFYYQSINRGQ